jgi:hypothetical protein
MVVIMVAFSTVVFDEPKKSVRPSQDPSSHALLVELLGDLSA